MGRLLICQAGPPSTAAGRRAKVVVAERDSSVPDEAQPALDELAGLMLAGESTASTLDLVAASASQLVPGAAEVSLTLVSDGQAGTAVFTGGRAIALDERQYRSGYGPCLAAAAGGEQMHIADMRTETRWPQFTAAALACGVLALLSTPVPLGDGGSAAVNLYGTEAREFNQASMLLAKRFASYAGVALSNVQVYEGALARARNLEVAMASRAVIEQAKGVLMAQRNVPADAAFDLLVQASQRSNRRVRDLAQSVVDSYNNPADVTPAC